jgi:hypothetical protein
LQRGDQVTMHNNSVASEGDCLVIAECDIEHSVCDGSERVVMRNNLFAGFHDFVSSDELTCLTYSENITEQVFDMDYSLIYNTKSTPPCPGSHDLCEVSPGVLINAIDAFDGRLLESSPAVGQADPANAPAEDFTRRQRDSSPDIGAYEWVAPVSWAYLSAVYASGE